MEYHPVDGHLTFKGSNPLDHQVGGGHYKDMKIQPVVFITENQLPFLEGNAIKYICRHSTKNGAQDIEKAIHYLQLILQLKYGVDLEQ